MEKPHTSKSIFHFPDKGLVNEIQDKALRCLLERYRFAMLELEYCVKFLSLNSQSQLTLELHWDSWVYALNSGFKRRNSLACYARNNAEFGLLSLWFLKIVTQSLGV